MAIVKKQRTSLWTFLREAPRDWFLGLSEDYELVDWSKVSEATSWPCALALNVLFVLVTIARQLNSRGSDLDAIVDADHGYRTDKGSRGSSGTWGDADTRDSAYGVSKKSLWTSFLLFLNTVLILASVANAWVLFSSRRTYQLRPKDESTVASTPNCRRVTMGTRRPQWADSLWGWPLWMLWKWITQLDDQIQGEIWELSVWEPPIFSRNLFCWYSPIQVLVMWFMDGSNWYYILPLAAAVGAQSSFIVRQYSVLVKDKQILFGEVYNEYNEKFVHPRVFASKKDVGTSTMEDWALARKASIIFGIGRYGTGIDNRLNKRRTSPPRRHTASVATRDTYVRESMPPINPYDSREPAMSRNNLQDSREHAMPRNNLQGSRESALHRNNPYEPREPTVPRNNPYDKRESVGPRNYMYDPQGPAVPVSLMNGRRETGANRYSNMVRHSQGRTEFARTENYENDPASRLPSDPIGTQKVRDRSFRRQNHSDLMSRAKGSM
ncbi:hypothetical protein EV175_003196 [Coemansia sp. RSA 1933]|nr:hypothetical protein EV175_003196 [Coemansia sp. RSA 1933]